MPAEILSTDAMRAADAFAIRAGTPGAALMGAAGKALCDAIIARWTPRPAAVLCGPGNNGGDGFVCARLLAERGWPVRVFLLGAVAALKGDALAAAQQWRGEAAPLSTHSLRGAELVVDALFGAGLTRSLEGAAAALAQIAGEGGRPVIAADVPSGLDGDRARADGPVFQADLTVTFHRLKPAHVLSPGRGLCGEVVLADIGIPDGWAAETEIMAEVNGPDLWPHLPAPGGEHKHRRGRLAVLGGPAHRTGAARLAARAGLRAGAGLVTVLAPPEAITAYAPALESEMLRPFVGAAGFLEGLAQTRATAAVIGPAAGVGAATREIVLAALSTPAPLVLDADALTSFEAEPQALFATLRATDVLTPHEGEFERLFPGLLAGSLNRIEAAKAAAKAAGAVVLLKGPETVIAAPDGRARVNIHATSWLATAGTGDVLAGMIGAFLAGGADAFDAASAAAWLHGDAGIALGPGLIASDLPQALPGVYARLFVARSEVKN
ncbi:MAG: NAD(P)H-hydrate dehydratase [Maricaulaceae bacterium]|nr:NAD(P)H-hydrate dehydratase [Maricaulaceae bacterium]